MQATTERRAILILDNQNVASTLRRLIHTWVSDTHDILTATSVEEALGYLAERTPALVITEYEIARRPSAKINTGLDLAQYIKQANAQTRVILLTTYDYTSIDFATVKRSVDVYLHKPFILRELQDAVFARFTR